MLPRRIRRTLTALGVIAGIKMLRDVTVARNRSLTPHVFEELEEKNAVG